MRKIIVYFGIIQYKEENAMCQRAEGIKRLISAVGYTPIIIAVSNSIPRNKWRKRTDDIYEINTPHTMLEWMHSCISAKDIKEVLKNIGIKYINTVIMADYRYLPMKKISKFCKNHGINYVVDIMDWFVADKTLNSRIKKIDNDLRMKKLYPKIDNRIYICSSYKKVLNMTEHTAVIPGVTFNEVHNKFMRRNDKIVLFFAGNPGRFCEKERIDWVINSFRDETIAKHFVFYIAGVEKEKYVLDNMRGEEINENVIFLGRITHERCLRLLRKSDFSLVIRNNNQLSNYGFSTKIGEAFQNGIPVIATDTSDNSKYIRDGINGYIVDCSEEAVKKFLLKLCAVDITTIDYLKEQTFINNPLSYKNYISDFKKVIGE